MIGIQDDVGMQMVREIRDNLYAERQTMTQQERCDRVRRNAARMLVEMEQFRQPLTDGVDCTRASSIYLKTVAEPCQ